MADSPALLLPADIAAPALIDRLAATARQAAQALDGDPGPAALHDFRVALRRLRALLKANEPWLDDRFPKDYREALKNLARRSNPQRDLDVQLVWLKGMRNTADLQPGHRQLVARLTAESSASQDLGGALAREFSALQARLENHRQSPRAPIGDGPVYAKIVARQLAKAEKRFTRLLSVVTAGDRNQLHTARIAGKQLRYVVESLPGLEENSGPLLAELKKLQDTLGKLHDCQVFAGALPTLAGQLAANSPALPGIDGIARRLAKRERKLWRKLAAGARDGRLDRIAKGTRQLRKKLQRLETGGA